MEEFNELLQILDRLLAPNGCPWDREQTLHSMRSSLVEETSEVIEAIDLDDNFKIEEELGDLLFNAVFLGRLAEKENRFTLSDALRHISLKLIRRHPHVFGESIIHNSEEVLKQWESIKKAEKGEERKSILDGIPKDLPTLTRAYKVFKRIKKSNFDLKSVLKDYQNPELQLGQQLFNLVAQHQEKGLDAEQALRAYLSHLQRKLIEWEKEQQEG